MPWITLAAMLLQDWTITEVASLLSGVCRTSPRYAELSTFGCETKVHGAAFTGMLRSFNARGVIYGHFLSPMSEDAIRAE